MLKVEYESISFSKESLNDCWLLFCWASIIREEEDGSMHQINNPTTINKKTKQKLR